MFDMFELYFSFICLLIVGADKINERRILLPYNSGIPTNFTLITSGETSCYKWSSSRPDIASVKPIENDSCSKRAIVTVVSTVPKRQSTIITAHEQKTNLQIRCDVEIDVIKKIVIQTTTKEIVYGELPETIKIYAYSGKNDMFTSIGGISFDWNLNPSDIVRYRLWTSSPYSAPDFVEYWESHGGKSSNILVEGIKTGSVNIRASILDDAYQSLPPAEINIHVVANLLLIPSNDIFLIPGAQVYFRAEIYKQGPRVSLNFPNEQYYLEVTDSNVAVFDEKTNMLEALSEGHTSLVLKDRNMLTSSLPGNDSDLLFSRTRTDIYVIQPDYISVSIQPGNVFQLCNDYIYNLQLTLHDHLHHLLFLTDNLEFEFKVDNEYCEILKSSKNKTFHVVKTKKIGQTKFIAQFHGAGAFKLREPLMNVQEVTIYSPIQLTPEQVYLPLIKSLTVPTYIVNVEASGATQIGYNWQTNVNDSIATVKYSSQKSSQAIVNVKPFGLPGEISIICTDVQNSQIFNAIMSIHILPIHAIEILPSIVETSVGGNILLPLAVLSLKGVQKIYFDDCSQVKFDVDIVEKNRIRYAEDSFMPGMGKHSCRSLSFECLASGNSRVVISYQANSRHNISTHAIIGCYKSLKLVHPEEFAILSLGSGIDIAFEGGPRPWSMFPEGHYSTALPSNSSIVELKEIRDRYRYNKDLHIFRAYCKQYGETTIELKVGNKISPTLPNPALTYTSVRLMCSRPETLIIKPRTKPTCPQQDAQFTMEKNRNIELDVEILDQNGLNFYNFSTFYFEWSKNVGTGIFEAINGVNEEVNGARGYAVLNRSYQILSKFVSNDIIRIQCSITGYKPRLYSWYDRFDISREIELIITDEMLSKESSVTILKHVDYRKTISIDKGSGYFNIDWSGKSIIDIETNANDKRKFMITPLETGTGVITINDLCLDYSPYTMLYSVVEPIEIKLQLVDKIQLGDQIEATFFVLDNRGDKLNSSLHSFLNFFITSLNNFVSFGEIYTKDEFHSSFKIKAERLGICKLLIQSQSPKMRSIQAQIELQIFSPLQIFPNNITLIVGNYFQPNFLGGPQTQRNIEFSIDDGKIATTVNTNGLIQARQFGRTHLTARVTSVDNYEYSRASADLYVLPLKKIKIWAPINQMLMGATVPMYLIGQSEQYETPFMFGHADPPLKISWSMSNDKIGSLECSFQKLGISGQIVDQISTNFLAKSIGSVTVKVIVEVLTPAKDIFFEQIDRNQLLIDTIQLTVYPNYVLTVSSPTGSINNYLKETVGQTLLMSQKSELLLHENQLDLVDYRILNTSSQVKLINQTGNLVIKAGDQLESSFLMIKRDLYRTGVYQYYSQAIHVEKVRYLMLELDPIKYAQLSTTNLFTFPIGSDIIMIVRYYDQLGRRFDAVNSNIKWFLSRNDIITILDSSESTQSLRVRCLKHGSVILNIWDELNNVQQFYKIIVGSAIESMYNHQSQKSHSLILQVGDVICMRTRLDESDCQNNGVWSLVDQELYSIGWIHSQSGLFLALNPGKALLTYNHSSSISTYKHVQVEPLNFLALNIDTIVGFTTAYTQTIPILVSDNNLARTQHQTAVTCCMPEQNLKLVENNFQLPFSCDVAFENDLEITELPWNVELEYENNHWSCVLYPKTNLDLKSIALWNKNAVLTVMARSLSDAFLQSSNSPHYYNSPIHQVKLPFLPEFQISLKQIILTSESPQVYFTVYSNRLVLDNLMVIPNIDDILLVKTIPIEKDSNSMKNSNSLRILVQLKSIDIFTNDVSNLHILLSSKLINQTEQINVQIKLYGQNQFFYSSDEQHYFYWTLLFIFTAIIAFFIYFALKKLLIFNGKHKIIHYDSSSPIKTSFQNSPRVIDYNQAFEASHSPNRPSTLDMNSPKSSLSPRILPSTDVSNSPISPKRIVGRNLYSTRSLFS